MKIEQRLIADLIRSPQSRALQHIFFAERQTRKIPADFLPGITSGGERQHSLPTKINRIGVIGAGTMGTGIAICFLNVGVEVGRFPLKIPDFYNDY